MAALKFAMKMQDLFNSYRIINQISTPGSSGNAKLYAGAVNQATTLAEA